MLKNDDIVIDILKTQLEVKDKQIEQLQRTVEQLTAALTSAQALNAADKHLLLQFEDKLSSQREKKFPSEE